MIILASASPRRKELLSELVSEFKIVPATSEEKITEGLKPADTVILLAHQKAEEVAAKFPSDVVIGADTVVYCDGEILGKPCDEKDAVRMLGKLSGKLHSVFTGVCIVKNGVKTTFANETKVEFYELTNADINAYIATGEPFDKAGAYGIQGKGAVLVKAIEGDFFNVMGLPIGQLDKYLKKLDIYEKNS